MMAVLTASLASSACDDPPSALGVTERDGKWVILFAPCSESRVVESVELEAETGESLWRIDAAESTQLREFAVGDETPGFSTMVPLEPGPLSGRFRATVNGVGPEFFSANDVVEGSVFVVGEGSMSVEEFWARDTCG
jgi:hypothetical protein